MKKVLFTATVENHLYSFHTPYLKWFKEQGYQVHTASKEEGRELPVDKKHDISFARSPFKLDNLKAYRELKTLINNEDYDIIHCHTPMGGALTRLAARKARKKGTRLIYTAHGFHFFKGAPLINWLLYYPVEKILARYTDILITINNEDYENAMKKRFKAKKIELIDGVGINLKKFRPQTIVEKNRLRNEYGYKEEDFILIYAGELNYNKNQSLLFKAIALLKEEIPEIKLLLAGTGDLLEDYQSEVSQLGIKQHVEFLGYRNDVPSLMLLSDIGVSVSKREGLPVNVMEAMATGLALVVTDCRGNRDLVVNGENGYVIEMDDADGFAAAISKLHDAADLRKTMAEHSLQLIEKYSIERVMEEMERVYAIKGV